MRRLAAALLVCACFPERHPLVGTRCDGNQRCPDELVCIADRCRPKGTDAGADGDGGAGGGGGSANLIENGDFEVVAVDPWMQEQAVGTTYRIDPGAGTNGSRGGVVQNFGASTGVSQLVTRVDKVRPAPKAGTYCAEIWAKGINVSNAAMQVTVRGNQAGGMILSTPIGTFARTAVQLTANQNDALGVRLFAQLSVGGQLFFDDASLKPGACP